MEAGEVEEEETHLPSGQTSVSMLTASALLYLRWCELAPTPILRTQGLRPFCVGDVSCSCS